ncbi:Yrb2p KNAG_0D01560 [Huiozyma naganishii CBS 8797]|uniref:RanBD1 domain-containing protein n=1 Tax=Huiozyma naganishii (strain ATCC MYA-139 / BCRC 22969 / CBS 8797 / KCTC 17520 / NBRC 10181 / NCYC 3082 / Yp74L-3) TaxID=1071383 RepID=J7RK71_HUIN7|nr:hypothetical protein KNAG_0D01560 [Kazachstania naganishii CBS 8797]CCK69908.1 hypothetical protein KNAG_0D01560 [Kazachstania naganishii CBS 8797]
MSEEKHEKLGAGEVDGEESPKKRCRDESSSEGTSSRDETDVAKESQDTEKQPPKKLKLAQEDEQVVEEPTEKPKFVFGAATSFGSGFKMVNKDSEASPDSSAQKEDTVEAEKKELRTKPFAFGSKFSFGSGFNVLKKTEGTPETGDNTPHESSPENKSGVSGDERSSTAPPADKEEHLKLHKQDVQTGEENETCVYQTNAKLFQLQDIKSGWKERGFGAVKINKNDATGKYRLLMRARGVLKAIMNLPIVKGYTVEKGFGGSLQGERFIRILAVDGNNKPITYALKTHSEDIANDLYDHIKEVLK